MKHPMKASIGLLNDDQCQTSDDRDGVFGEEDKPFLPTSRRDDPEHQLLVQDGSPLRSTQKSSWRTSILGSLIVTTRLRRDHIHASVVLKSPNIHFATLSW